MTITSTQRANALTVFDAALSRAATGAAVTLTLSSENGDEQQADAASWCRPQLPGDRQMLDRCAGPALDVGCGNRLRYLADILRSGEQRRFALT